MCNPLLYIYFVLPATPETRFSGISCQYLLPDLPATVYIFSVNMTQQETFNDPAIDYSIPKKEAAKSFRVLLNQVNRQRHDITSDVTNQYSTSPLFFSTLIFCIRRNNISEKIKLSPSSIPVCCLRRHQLCFFVIDML